MATMPREKTSEAVSCCVRSRDSGLRHRWFPRDNLASLCLAAGELRLPNPRFVHFEQSGHRPPYPPQNPPGCCWLDTCTSLSHHCPGESSGQVTLTRVDDVSLVQLGEFDKGVALLSMLRLWPSGSGLLAKRRRSPARNRYTKSSPSGMVSITVRMLGRGDSGAEPLAGIRNHPVRCV